VVVPERRVTPEEDVEVLEQLPEQDLGQQDEEHEPSGDDVDATN
jgi:hypothetical protein